MDLLTGDGSYSYESIMGEDTLTLYFSHPGYLDIPVGSWCEFHGKRYSLKKDGNFKKNGERNYEYTILLETSKADTELWKIRNTVDNRIKFPYTAKPKEHLKLIIDNLNRRSSGWVIGECIDGTEKLINYNHTVCLDGLNQFAETYETEWQITEQEKEKIVNGPPVKYIEKTIHLRKVEYNKDTPLALSYGKGHGFKVGVGREFGAIPPEIILVETTDRNIDYSKYGAKELLMPKSQTIRFDGTYFEDEEGFDTSQARIYKTDEYGTSVMRADRELTTAKEDSLDCSEIYPSRVGTVSEVIKVTEKGNTFYDFKDKDIPAGLDFSQYRIDGEKATIIFQSGMFAGKEFDLEQTDAKLTGYVHSERRFKLVSQEIDGITMPDGGVWMPKVGEKYTVFGIQLPEAYICDNATKTGASWEVFKEAVKYLYGHEDKKFTFTGILDGIWAKKRWLQIGGKIVLGGFVNFTDNQFHPEGSLIRMTGIKRYVNNPYSPEIELSNSPVGTSIIGELNKIETNEVTVDENHKKARQFTKRYFRDARETMEMLAGSLLNFSGAINPVTVATMQMLVGDESLQYRFVSSRTSPAVVNHEVTYNPSTKVLHVPSGIIQHMTLGITEIKNAHAAGDYKYWDMAGYDSPSLVEPEKKFYLYAKCGKDNQAGIFLLSEAAITLEQVPGYYHLLVGILNSEDGSGRSFATLYGFTEILPGRVTTDKIVSSDGNTYFDLLKGIIGGKISFSSGSSGLENLEEWPEVSRAISDARLSADNAGIAAGNANKSVSDLNAYVDGAFADGIVTEAEARAIEKYINVVESTKADMEAAYGKLYSNTYLSGTAKTDLLNAKITFSGSVDKLIAAINDAIADGKATVGEKQNVDGRYSEFNNSCSSLSQAIETANKAIQDTLKGYSDAALKEAQDAAKAASDAANSAGEANKAVADLSGSVYGAFADGIIEESEARAIEKYINTVNATKSAIEAIYNKLYLNTYLDGTPKTDLLNAKVTLMGAISNLISSINTAIADGKTTVPEKKDVDSKFSAFNSAYAGFNTAVESANKAIQDKLRGYSDGAKTHADGLSTVVKDDLAKSLGYPDYSSLESAARGGETIIDGGKINTALIEAEAIMTTALLARMIKTTELVAEHFNLSGGRIGAFDIVNNVLTNVSDEPKASIEIEKKNSKYFKINSPTTSAMCKIRGDGINALDIQGYGDGSVGVYVKANGGMCKAIQSYGNAELHTDNGESSFIQGMRMNVRFITSSCAIQSNDDFLRFTPSGNITVTMPSASNCSGKIYYIKITSGNVTFTGSNFRGSNDWQISTGFSWGTGPALMMVSDGSVWNLFYCG